MRLFRGFLKWLKSQILPITLASIVILVPKGYKLLQEQSFLVRWQKFKAQKIVSLENIRTSRNAGDYLTFNILSAQEDMKEGNVSQSLKDVVSYASSVLKKQNKKKSHLFHGHSFDRKKDEPKQVHLKIALTESSRVLWSDPSDPEKHLFFGQGAVNADGYALYIELLRQIWLFNNVSSKTEQYPLFFAELVSLELAAEQFGKPMMTNRYRKLIASYVSKEELINRLKDAKSVDDILLYFHDKNVSKQRSAAQLLHLLMPKGIKSLIVKLNKKKPKKQLHEDT